MNFTNQELGLLVDAISWEQDLFEVWSDSPRHAMLRDLQERIQKAIDENNDLQQRIQKAIDENND